MNFWQFSRRDLWHAFEYWPLFGLRIDFRRVMAKQIITYTGYTNKLHLKSFNKYDNNLNASTQIKKEKLIKNALNVIICI